MQTFMQGCQRAQPQIIQTRNFAAFKFLTILAVMGSLKPSSDDGGGSFLLSLVRKNGPLRGIVRTSMQGCQRAKPQNKQR